MIQFELINSDTFTLIILPVLIFLSRVADVTLGTIRIIFVSRGKRSLAPFFGFFEILIWLFAIGQIMQNFTNITYYFAYAAGFASGNFIGIYIEDKMALGTLIIRIITRKDAHKLVKCLKSEGYGVTNVDAYGATGPVNIVYTIIKRKDVKHVVKLIKQFNPRAFYSIEEVRLANEGIFPANRPRSRISNLTSLNWNRKGK